MNSFDPIFDLSGVGWISVDIFDTLLMRNGRCEAERFLDAAVQCAKTLKIKHLDSNDIWVARMIAHNRCYRLSQPLMNQKEPDLKTILRVTSLILGLAGKDQERFIQCASTIEFDIETAGLRLNSALLAQLIQAKKPSGPKFLLLSDMYLPRNFVYELVSLFLNKNIDLFEHVFVSNVLGAQKQDGTAYLRVAQLLKHPAGQFLHIGDNYFSDVVQAKRMGWKTLFLGQDLAQEEALRRSFSRIKKLEHKLGIVINHLY